MASMCVLGEGGEVTSNSLNLKVRVFPPRTEILAERHWLVSCLEEEPGFTVYYNQNNSQSYITSWLRPMQVYIFILTKSYLKNLPSTPAYSFLTWTTLEPDRILWVITLYWIWGKCENEKKKPAVPFCALNSQMYGFFCNKYPRNREPQ